MLYTSNWVTVKQFFIYLVVILGLRTSATADDSTNARQLLREGARFFQSGDLLRARTAFAAAHELVPAKANPYRWLGLVDARLGRCSEAIANLDSFLRLVQAGDARIAEAQAARAACAEALASVPKPTLLEPHAAAGPQGSEEPQTPSLSPAPPPSLPAPLEAATATMTAPTDPPSRPTVRRRPLYKRWWLWTLAGAVVAGSAAALVLAVDSGGRAALPAVHVR